MVATSCSGILHGRFRRLAQRHLVVRNLGLLSRRLASGASSAATIATQIRPESDLRSVDTTPVDGDDCSRQSGMDLLPREFTGQRRSDADSRAYPSELPLPLRQSKPVLDG